MHYFMILNLTYLKKHQILEVFGVTTQILIVKKITKYLSIK